MVCNWVVSGNFGPPVDMLKPWVVRAAPMRMEPTWSKWATQKMINHFCFGHIFWLSIHIRNCWDLWTFVSTNLYRISEVTSSIPIPDETITTPPAAAGCHAQLLATSSKASRKASLVSCATGSTKEKGITWRRAGRQPVKTNHGFL